MSKQKDKSVFVSKVIERRRLNDPRSDKKTYHVVLDITDSDIQYEVGDCVKVYPENNPLHVHGILQILGFSGEEIVETREKKEITIEQFLTKEANLNKVPKKLLSYCSAKDESPDLSLHEFLKRTRPTLSTSVLSTALMPLMPRFYSIASSQLLHQNEIHLTIAVVGVASDFLCSQVALHTDEVCIAHHPSHHFRLPNESNEKPIIMVGPGTGIAPFRGFLQQRVLLHPSQKNWLFFGERNYAYDFYYQDFFEQLSSQEYLRLNTAFSRDEEKKCYVHHKMWEHKEELWHWIDQKKAYFFVCGDKQNMAKDVEHTLLRIFSEVGKLSLPQSKAYLQSLRKNQRYLRDVY